MQISEFGGRAVVDQLKHSDKGGQAGETGLQGGLGNGKVGIRQKFFRVFNPFLIQIFIEGNPGEIFEQPGEMVLAEAHQCSGLVQTEVLCAVFVNVVAQSQKLFRVFLLLLRDRVGGVSLAGVFPADQNQHFEQHGIDGSADKNGAAVVFPGDGKHELLKFGVDGGSGGGCEEKRLGNRG